MADPSLDQLLWSIGIQESGNNYSVVNSIGAVGKYQVMKANIPSWSKAALGYSITWQQFRDSPDLQEKIVRHRMKGYYDKYGFRGAASAWYSGNPTLYNSTRPQSGGPSIKSYVDSVYNRALKAPSNISRKGGSTGSPSASGGGGAAPPKSRSETAENYGFNETLFNSVPELKKLFDKAVKGQWTASKFQAALRDTKWWKTKGEDARKFLMLQYGDPASAKQQMAQQRTKIKQMAAQLGIKVDASLSKRLDKWVMDSLMNGWTDGQMRDELGKYVTFGGDNWLGEGGDVMEKLKTYAYQMGVTFDGKWFADRARKVVRGMATEQDFESEIRKAAKGVYSQWGKQLDAGQTVADIAAPYFASMAQILELPPGSVNLFDPTIKKALQSKDKTTGQNVVTPMWQFENNLRSDSRWKGTQNAQNSMMQVAHQILADFGVKT